MTKSHSKTTQHQDTTGGAEVNIGDSNNGEPKDVNDSGGTTTTTTDSIISKPPSPKGDATLEPSTLLLKPTTSIHPFVFWAQSQTHISLRVDLIQAEKLEVSVGDDGSQLTFSAFGTGAHGQKEYYFTLEFYSKVDNKLECHTIERYVLLLINKPKSKQVNWPRLTQQAIKLPWLRVDFDRYAGSDDSDDNAGYDEDDNDEALRKGERSFELLKQQLKESKQQKEQEEKFSTSIGDTGDEKQQNLSNDSDWKQFRKSNSDIFNPFNRRTSRNSHHYSGSNMKYDYRKDASSVQDSGKNTAKQALDLKKTYLFLYNVVMFIMFLKVWLVLLIKGFGGTVDDDIIVSAAFIVKLLTYTQLLETMHPMLGLVPGGPFMPFLQTIGRLIVNEFLTDSRIRLDAVPYAHYLLIVWSSIEIFRYSLYALRVFKVNIYPLTWCRYTLFLPLYPMGGFCESMVLFSTIKIYEKTGNYSVDLPNAANISFSLPLFLRFYIFFLLGPSIYYLMLYMWKQRCKQLKEKVA